MQYVGDIAMTDIESITCATGRGHLIPGPQSLDSAKLVTPSLQPRRARRDLCLELGSRPAVYCRDRQSTAAVSRSPRESVSGAAATLCCTAISEIAGTDSRRQPAISDAWAASRFARRAMVVVMVALQLLQLTPWCSTQHKAMTRHSTKLQRLRKRPLNITLSAIIAALYFYNGFGKCGSILIICSLLHLEI